MGKIHETTGTSGTHIGKSTRRQIGNYVMEYTQKNIELLTDKKILNRENSVHILRMIIKKRIPSLTKQLQF